MNAQPDPTHQDATAAQARETFRHAHAAMAEEHEQIMALLDVLQNAPDPSRLVRRLEELHTLLINHFAHEQFPGGLYESMGAFGSRWHEHLRELIRDHCLILSEARAVLERARVSTPHTQDALQAAVIALIKQLSTHERKEHHLAERLRSSTESNHA